MTSQLPSLTRQSTLKRGHATLSDSDGDYDDELQASLAQQAVAQSDSSEDLDLVSIFIITFIVIHKP